MSTGSANPITYFANFRNKRKTFGIKQADRMAYMYIYITGKTASGKSTLIETLIRQDIESGR